MSETAEKLDEFVNGMGEELADEASLSAEDHAALRAITKGDEARALAIPDEVTDALTPDLLDRREFLEGVIRKNFRGFIEVGLALKEIRDRRLYISSHSTFEQYCRENFEIERTLAYKKIEAADVAFALSAPDSIVGEQNVENFDIAPSGLVPLESHARKLAELPPEDRPEAWKRACQRGIERHGRVTAKTVAEVVAEKLGKRTEDAIATAKKSTSVSKKTNREVEFVDPDFTTALQNLLNEIGAARQRNWYGVPKQRVVASLRAVLDAIEME